MAVQKRFKRNVLQGKKNGHNSNLQSHNRTKLQNPARDEDTIGHNLNLKQATRISCSAMSSWRIYHLYSVRLACFFSFSIFRAVSSSAVGDRLLLSSTSCIVHVVFFFLTTIGMSGSRTGSVIRQVATMMMMIKNNVSLFEGLLEYLWACREKLHVLRYRRIPNNHWITPPNELHYWW